MLLYFGKNVKMQCVINYVYVICNLGMRCKFECVENARRAWCASAIVATAIQCVGDTRHKGTRYKALSDSDQCERDLRSSYARMHWAGGLEVFLCFPFCLVVRHVHRGPLTFPLCHRMADVCIPRLAWYSLCHELCRR